MKKNMIYGVATLVSLAAVWHVWSKKQGLAEGESLDTLTYVEGGLAAALLVAVIYKSTKNNGNN